MNQVTYCFTSPETNHTNLLLPLLSCNVQISSDFLSIIINLLLLNNSYIVDLVKNTFYSNSAKNITLNNFDISKTYYDQHHDIIFKNSRKACSFGEGIDILKFIEAAEKSNQGKTWVKV